MNYSKIIGLPVTITIVGTTRRMITVNNGTYSIEVLPSEKQTFSFIGMESQLVDAGNQKTIEFPCKAPKSPVRIPISGFGV